MVLFVGAHRPDRKPVFRFSGFSVFWVFRSSGCSAGRVCRDSGRAADRVRRGSGFARGPGFTAPGLPLFRPRGASDAHFGLRPLTFYFGCRPGTVCRFRRGVSPVSLPPGAVSGCRRCPRSGGAACASGACRRSSAPPLRARSPGRARVWRSTTARRRSP